MVEKILLVNEEQSRSDILLQGIKLAGYAVQKELNEFVNMSFCLKEKPAAIILNSSANLTQHIPFLKELCSTSPLPTIVFVKSASKEEIEQAIKSGVHALIVNGLVSERIPAIIEMAIIRFAEQQAKYREYERIKRSLEDRKTIDRAKGVLMDMRGMKEQEAYQSLRKLAMDQNKRMVEVCNDVIEMFKYIA